MGEAVLKRRNREVALPFPHPFVGAASSRDLNQPGLEPVDIITPHRHSTNGDSL